MVIVNKKSIFASKKNKGDKGDKLVSPMILDLVKIDIFCFYYTSPSTMVEETCDAIWRCAVACLPEAVAYYTLIAEQDDYDYDDEHSTNSTDDSDGYGYNSGDEANKRRRKLCVALNRAIERRFDIHCDTDILHDLQDMDIEDILKCKFREEAITIISAGVAARYKLFINKISGILFHQDLIEKVINVLVAMSDSYPAADFDNMCMREAHPSR